MPNKILDKTILKFERKRNNNLFQTLGYSDEVKHTLKQQRSIWMVRKASILLLTQNFLLYKSKTLNLNSLLQLFFVTQSMEV